MHLKGPGVRLPAVAADGDCPEPAPGGILRTPEDEQSHQRPGKREQETDYHTMGCHASVLCPDLREEPRKSGSGSTEIQQAVNVHG
jgi:hypothetical protein